MSLLGWICGGTRLGNKLSMMSAAIGAAADYNMTFVLQKADETCGWVSNLQDLFITLNTTTPILPNTMISHWKNVAESGFTKFDPINRQPSNFTIAGFRQSWKYFSSKVANTAVRKAFRFAEKYNRHISETFTKIKGVYANISEPIFVGVHMRIGDLVGNTYGYQMANQSFYHTALQAAYSNFNSSKSIIFVAASDSPNLGKNMLVNEQKYNIYWLSGNAFEDFVVLSSCNHSITSGGTYGFWVSWIAGGTTFYFAHFAKEGSPFAKGFNNENFYLPEWKAVGWH